MGSTLESSVSALSTAQYWQVKFLTPELMTAKEVEELLRIDVKTVYSYVKRGLLPYVKIQSNVRFLRSAMLEWMEEKQYKLGSRGGWK